MTGFAALRAARDLSPRSHTVPVRGRSGARPSTRRAPRKMLICSGIRERYAQDEHQLARRLRYQLRSPGRRDRRDDIRTKVNSTQPANGSNRPCGLDGARQAATSAAAKAASASRARHPEAGSAESTPYSTGIASRLTIPGDLPALTGLLQDDA
jgi:hypothetical protein